MTIYMLHHSHLAPNGNTHAVDISGAVNVQVEHLMCAGVLRSDTTPSAQPNTDRCFAEFQRFHELVDTAKAKA